MGTSSHALSVALRCPVSSCSVFRLGNQQAAPLIDNVDTTAKHPPVAQRGGVFAAVTVSGVSPVSPGVTIERAARGTSTCHHVAAGGRAGAAM